MAAAAAAPVIALANTVSITDAAGAWLEARKSSRVNELQDALIVAVGLSAINFINQTISLGIALSCLYDESDNSLNIPEIVLILLGIVVTLVVTGLSAGFRVITKLDRNSEVEPPDLVKSLTDVEKTEVDKKETGLGWPGFPQ